jgi:hypothetical protein
MLSSELFAMFVAIAIIMPLFTDGTEAGGIRDSHLLRSDVKARHDKMVGSRRE